MKFYDQLAVDYDQMIGFDDRLEKEAVIFRKIFDRFPAKNILDTGCGTGFHSIVFALLGKNVTAIDNSAAMLAKARENSRQWQASPEFIKADFLNFNRQIKIQFDAIYCLGNSFAHLLTAAERRNVLRNFKQALTPQGYVFLQVMNYDKILKEKPQIFSVKEQDQRRYVRSYQYQPATIIFTIRIETPAGKREISHELYPLQSAEVSKTAAESGFNKVSLFGNLSLSEYDQYHSENICAVLSD
jgi:SAM-dependent methyltransferase